MTRAGMPTDRLMRDTSAEFGLICGFAVSADGASRQIGIGDIDGAVADADSVVWLHFNAAHAGARRLLAHSAWASADLLRLIENHDLRTQISATSAELVGVVNDLAFGDHIDPSEVATLWVYASRNLLVTARNHAGKTADVMRQAAREGLVAASGQSLLCQLLEAQSDLLRAWLAEAAQQLDHSEDRILIGEVAEQREDLGRVRRLAMHLRRHFAPIRVALNRLLAMPADRRGAIDVEAWRVLHDDLAFAVEEASSLYERAKLLQEELASRLAEATSNNLYVLTVWTIVFLPLTLISGIFGMNVSGVPGVGEHLSGAPFWWVMVLLVLVGVLVLVLVRRRRLL